MIKDKQKYESVLALFKEPMQMKDVIKSKSEYLFVNRIVKILSMYDFVEKSKGKNENGRAINLYQAKKFNLTDSEVAAIKSQSAKNAKNAKTYAVKNPIQYASTKQFRQILLDLFTDGNSVNNVFMKIRHKTKNALYYSIELLLSEGYLQDVSVSRFKRYKTIIPVYVQSSKKVKPEIKQAEPVIVKGYVNGIVRVSSNDYHPARMARTSPRNYVSGSTLSIAV